MKYPTTFITCVIFTCFLCLSINVQAQTKREVQFSLDTLKTSFNKLQQDYSSLQDEWKLQNQFFEHVKSQFFPPSDINMSINEASGIFDDINETLNKQLNDLVENNETFSDSITQLNDSIIQLQKTVERLSEQNESFSALLMSSLNKASFPQSASEFVGIWDLFLDPIQLAGDPFESGIIGFNQFVTNDSIKQYSLYKIEFSPDEIATLYFNGRNEQKCFYSIKEFSINSPYVILFSKQEEFKLNMNVSPLPQGLMVSYEVPLKTKNVLYYYGLMKK